MSFYPFGEMVFYFTVYSCIGWWLENIYNFFTTGIFLKPNFFSGPFKPMYGFAPILLVTFIRPTTNWIVIILLCFFIPTLVEYASGYLLQKLFHHKWWDYSDMPLQLQGHICLPFSLCWIVLSFICLKLVHPFIASIFVTVDPYWNWFYPLVILYFSAEIIMSVKRHLLANIYV